MTTQPFRSSRYGQRSTGITTRAAGPEDAPLLSEVMRLAGDSQLLVGYWDLIRRDPDQAARLRTELILLERPSYANWRSFLVAELGGKPIGAASAYDATEPGFLTPNEALTIALERLGEQPDGVAQALDRLEPFRLCTFDPVPGVWTTEWVAVLPELQGKGIGRHLLRAILSRGRAQRYQRAQAVTYIGNSKAVKLYHSLGFQVVAERRDKRFESHFECPGLVRLETIL